MTHTVLFWNYNPSKADESSRPLGEGEQAATAAGLAAEQEADLVVLADCKVSKDLLLRSFRDVDRNFDIYEGSHDKVMFFARLPGRQLRVVSEDGRTSIRRLSDDSGRHQDVLLAATHFIDAYSNSSHKQMRAAESLGEFIIEAEERRDVGHKRTILFGDFNMNPYDLGMTDPKCLGAMMSRELAEKHQDYARKSTHRYPDRFYNPMWSKIGDPSCPGKYYWEDDEPFNPFWNTIDGVLIRPEMLTFFPDGPDNPAIVSSYRDREGHLRSLYRVARKHYKLAFSDHLPIRFRFTLPPITGG